MYNLFICKIFQIVMRNKSTNKDWIEILLELNKANEAEASKDKANEEAINA